MVFMDERQQLALDLALANWAGLLEMERRLVARFVTAGIEGQFPRRHRMLSNDPVERPTWMPIPHRRARNPLRARGGHRSLAAAPTRCYAALLPLNRPSKYGTHDRNSQEPSGRCFKY